MSERLGHLQSDVSRTHDEGRARQRIPLEEMVHRYCVSHRVQQVHAGEIDARQVGPDRPAPVATTRWS